jgi:Tfp pilus assembly protein PilX
MRAQNNCSLPASRQRGAVLVVAIVLLLLAGVMTLFALNVGSFEQRTTANDLRAKMVHQVAEAGVAQGTEFLFRQNAAWLRDTNRWEPCPAEDTNFPCGVVPQYEPDGVTLRRANMYRLRTNGHAIGGLSTALTTRMLPMANKIATVGNGETVAYGVAPVMCRAERPLPTDPPDTPIRCGDGTGSQATNLFIVTFASVATMPNEGARTTVVQTVGTYPLLSDLIGKPPLTTSGSVDLTGGLQVVTNPNAAGPGVPVSIWTRRDLDKTGTPNTCYADEFFRYTKNNVTPTLVPATCPADKPDCQSIRCDQCACDVAGSPQSLSYDNSGNKQDEGIDILDVEGNSQTPPGVAPHVGTNHNVRSDSLSYPVCEFPPDMFKFVFGEAAWNDTDNDCFAETKIMTQYMNPNTGALVTMGADEAWLFENAARVIPAADAAHTYQGIPAANLLRPGQAATSAFLNSSASGIIWCQTGCDIGANQEVGSPMNPVVLVADGPIDVRGIVWGFLFVRSTGNSLDPASGNSVAGGCPNNCMVQMNAGAVVYGAMVVQGQIKANGTAAVVHDAKVLSRLEEEGGSKFATLPGAWTDRRTY